MGDGQLAMQLGDLGGQKGWRLGLIRPTAGDLAPTVSAACVVSEVRPKGGRTFRMMALAVDGEMRGQGLATEAMGRLKEKLLLVAGPRFGLVADLASCMRKGGAGFYARQGWAGGEGSWSWRSEASEVEGAGDAPGQCPAPVQRRYQYPCQHQHHSNQTKMRMVASTRHGSGMRCGLGSM